MSYFRNIELSGELGDNDKERLGSIAREAKISSQYSSQSMDNILKEYNLTEQELLAIKNGVVSSEPVAEETPKEENKPEADKPEVPEKENTKKEEACGYLRNIAKSR